MWQTKYASAVPKHVGVGFGPFSEGDFLSGRPLSVIRSLDWFARCSLAIETIFSQKIYILRGFCIQFFQIQNNIHNNFLLFLAFFDQNTKEYLPGDYQAHNMNCKILTSIVEEFSLEIRKKVRTSKVRNQKMEDIILSFNLKRLKLWT